jgi:hypothetical protein
LLNHFVAFGNRSSPTTKCPSAIQHRHIDAPVLIALVKINPVGGMKEIGIENHRPVGAMRHGNGLGAALRKEVADGGFIAIVAARSRN